MKLYGDYPQTFGRVKSTPDNPAQYACAIERTSTDYSPAWYVWMAAIAVVATVVIVWTA